MKIVTTKCNLCGADLPASQEAIINSRMYYRLSSDTQIKITGDFCSADHQKKYIVGIIKEHLARLTIKSEAAENEIDGQL